MKYVLTAPNSTPNTKVLMTDNTHMNLSQKQPARQCVLSKSTNIHKVTLYQHPVDT